MDITYFESGYLEDGYFNYIAEGISLLAFDSQLTVSPSVSTLIRADLTSQSAMLTNGGKIVSYVGYTIFEPTQPKQPFSTEFYAPEVA